MSVAALANPRASRVLALRARRKASDGGATSASSESKQRGEGHSWLWRDEGKLLVLGGRGSSGARYAKARAVVGYDVVSISRRGDPPGDPHRYPDGVWNRVDWRKGDCVQPDTIATVLGEGGFVACIHAVEMLLASDINALASGNGSKPSPGATYDDVTRVTALNAADAAARLCTAVPNADTAGGARREVRRVRRPCRSCSCPPPRRVDVQGAGGLARGLPHRQRGAVEARLRGMTDAGEVRAACRRPSLVYCLDKPAAMPAVGAFYLGNLIGLPFVDRPVTVDTLASAAVRCVEDGRSTGALGAPRWSDCWREL